MLAGIEYNQKHQSKCYYGVTVIFVKMTQM